MILIPAIVAGYFGSSFLWGDGQAPEEPAPPAGLPWWATWISSFFILAALVLIALAFSPATGKDSAMVAISRGAIDTFGGIATAFVKQITGIIGAFGSAVESIIPAVLK